MELIQIFLPVRDNEGNPFSPELFQIVKKRLIEEFGGMTAFLRSPAEGAWEESPRKLTKDDVVTFEVMTEKADRAWWANYKKELNEKFKQKEVLIRKMRVELL